MSLQEEINIARAEIKTESYAMSIGEWISLYDRGEIDIHPEFQRYYRWSDYQKSRLIESILLGIPIPEIFVAQREDGVWDVVDGLQRLSTIFEFVGILKDKEGNLLEPLELTETKYLPSLKGKKWNVSDNEESSFDLTQRLIVKRSRIGVSIILRESDEKSKYELFQRLNTGGSPLSPQEVRNSILVMMNSDVYEWIRELSRNEDFKECVSLTDKALQEQYDMDIVLRFIIFRTIGAEALNNIGDVNEFLTDYMIDEIVEENFDKGNETDAFKTTFKVLNEGMGDDSFKRYDFDKERFLGGFLVSAFELVALGIGYNYEYIAENNKYIRDKIITLWDNVEFTYNSGSGVRASTRIPRVLELGRRAFSEDE